MAIPIPWTGVCQNFSRWSQNFSRSDRNQRIWYSSYNSLLSNFPKRKARNIRTGSWVSTNLPETRRGDLHLARSLGLINLHINSKYDEVTPTKNKIIVLFDKRKRGWVCNTRWRNTHRRRTSKSKSSKYESQFRRCYVKN